MKARSILIDTILWASVTAVFVRADVEQKDEDYEFEEVSYHLGHNSTYAERQWNITRGTEMIKDEYGENCLLEPTAPKQKKSDIRSKGPLCDICSQIVLKKFPADEPITMRYAAFLHGILTFPPTADEMLIDVVLCSYDPRIGIDRFYLTNGANESCVYLLENVGWQKSVEVANPAKDKKFKFVLDKLYSFR